MLTECHLFPLIVAMVQRAHQDKPSVKNLERRMQWRPLGGSICAKLIAFASDFISGIGT